LDAELRRIAIDDEDLRPLWDWVEVSEVLCLGSVYFSSVGSDFAMAR
jgi:hypothetical protein